MEVITNQRFQKTWKRLKLLLFIALIFSIILGLGIIGLILYTKSQGPPPLAVPQTTIFYGEDGTKIGEIDFGQDRYWVSLDDISPDLINATIAIEDRSFFSHNGFDYKRIFGAAIADIKAMAMVQGASTITMQYARNLFLEHDKTWERKLKEAFYTLRLELNYSKERILEGYLNTIYYGHGSYGIESAANYYFNKSAKELTLSESTLLAGIPKGPSHYSPYINFEKAKMRQKFILHSLVETDRLSKDEAATAYHAPLLFVQKHDRVTNNNAPYFQDIVMEELRNNIGIDEQSIQTKGLRVYTTLNPRMQKIAEDTINQTMSKDSDIQTAFVAMDPNTGKVKALVGGKSYEHSPFNRATMAERMPGSTFKPFLYYSAVEKGFSPSTIIESEPTTFSFNEGETYSPSNYNGYYAYDGITLAQALALSDNIYAVKTHMFLGMDTLVQSAKQLGISSKLLAVPSLPLGTSSVKVIDMVNAYSHFANGGKAVQPVYIEKVVDSSGEVLYENKPVNEQILNPDTTFVITHLMTGMFDERLNDFTTVTGIGITDWLTRPYAGKSGTTNTDSWMIGYTPQLISGVWFGYDRDTKITKVAEARYAKHVWGKFMEKALEDQPVIAFRPTDGVIGKYINPDNGELATKDCPVKRLTYFVKGSEPITYCNDHIGRKMDQEERQPQEQVPPEHDRRWYKKIIDWLF